MNVMLILIAACFVLPGLILGFLRFLKWKRRHRGQRPPFSDLLLRSPGEGLRREIQDLNDEITAFISSASIIPLLLICVYLISLISERERGSTGRLLFILGIGFGGYLGGPRFVVAETNGRDRARPSSRFDPTEPWCGADTGIR